MDKFLHDCYEIFRASAFFTLNYFLKFGKMRSRASRVMGFKAKGSDYPQILIVPHTVFPLIETTVLTAVSD